MKKLILFFVAGVVLNFTAKSQTTFSDNFDSYTAGAYLGQSNSNWTTWSHSPGGSDDTRIINTKSHSASNALYFSSVAGGPTDVVLPFTGSPYTTGNFSYSMWMFVDSGKKGYFNLQEQTTVGKGWTFDANFDSLGSLTFVNTISGTLFITPYTQNQWFKFEVKVNLNSNTWDIYLDNTLKGSFTNSYRAIASIDLYAMAGSSYYVDDVTYTYTPYTTPTLNAALTYIYNVQGFLATQMKVPQIEIRNLGTTNITSVSIQVSYNGINQTKTVSGLNLAPLAYDTIIMDNPITIVAGSNTFTATILTVNGTTDNDATDNSKSLVLNPVVPAAGKLVIAEECTGTWCGWCPRGTVFLKAMEDKYTGLFAGIAVHNNDPMMDSIYNAGMAATSFPNVKVDRGAWFDPSAMETDIVTRLMVAPVTRITNGAQYNSASRVLNISFTTKFLQAASGNYKIACVLSEDSITGTTSSYNQSNYYYSGSGKGVMGGFELLPNPVPAAKMVYDHVARLISPKWGGLQNAFNSTVNNGDSFIHNFTFTLPANWNANKIHIIGMVIDPSGRTDNGSFTTIATATANGYRSGTLVNAVQTLDAPDKPLAVYPNPSNTIFHVTLNNSSNAVSEIQIFNIRGELIQKINSFTGNEFLVDAQNWNNGIYLVRINSGDKVYTAKLIKD
ncbi:MAG: T9SS type A sorting domain-containing protein [Bacteroidia bacterium]